MRCGVTLKVHHVRATGQREECVGSTDDARADDHRALTGQVLFQFVEHRHLTYDDDVALT